MNDPFADLKKNINEMHKQQTQQQQQQQQFGYFPNQQQQQPNGFQQSPFQQQQQNNPFAMQQPQQNAYHQPVIPPRPTVGAGPNPFAQPAAPAAAAPPQSEFGWTVTKPVAAPRKPPSTPATPAAGNQSDPFAFLNNQTGGTGVAAVETPQATNGFSAQFTATPPAVSTGGGASADILDLLG